MKKIRLKTLLIMLTILIVGFQGCKKDEVAPAPAIVSFSPVSGVAGTTVHIAGSNFSITTDNNMVTFGGKAAKVTAAANNLLTVTVPQDAVTGKIGLTVGSNSVTTATDFTVLMSPTITSFTPASALPGATIMITGTNFDADPVKNTVKFKGVAATVTAATTTQLTVTVPSPVANGKITVTVNGLTATSATDFTIPSPTVTGFSPLNGAIGATVNITGTNFNTIAASNVVKFNDAVAIVTAATATQLTVTVPMGATTGKISVGPAVSSANFTVNTSIASLSASTGAIGKTILINGGGFSATPANNVVTFNGISAVVSAATAIQLTVEVPYGATSGPIAVASNGGTPATKDFTVVSAWTQKTDCPTNFGLATSFVIGNKAYLGAGFNSAVAQETAFYEFDPTGAGSWIVKQSSPATPLIVISGFSIADKGYSIDFTTGDIYKYVPGTNTWTKLINSGQSANNAAYESTFALGGRGYIKDEIGNLIEFNPAANNGNGSVTAVQAYPLGASAFQSAFVIGNVAYMGGGFDANNVATNNFYKYTNGVWTAIANLPGTIGFLSAFAIGQYGYVIQNGSVWRYNPAADSWTQLEDFPDNGASLRPAFSIGQKGYVSTGGTDSGGFIATGVTWEYDPSK